MLCDKISRHNYAHLFFYFSYEFSVERMDSFQQIYLCFKRRRNSFRLSGENELVVTVPTHLCVAGEIFGMSLPVASLVGTLPQQLCIRNQN